MTKRQTPSFLELIKKLRSPRQSLDSIFKSPFSRFLRFILVGFSGLFIDYIVFYLLFSQLDINLITSNVLSAEASIFNNFLLNDAWTFAGLAPRHPGWRGRVKRFLKFNLICLVGVVLNTLIVNLLVKGLNINAYIAKFIAAVLISFWNFGLNFSLNWRASNVQK